MKKERYDIEFVLGNASQRSLWRMLTDPLALEEWFADKVMLHNKTLFTFIWDKKAMNAEMVLKKPMTQVRYCWVMEESLNTYFEFKIHKQDLTGDMALEVSDFAYAIDREDSILLWQYQIDQLKRRLGI